MTTYEPGTLVLGTRVNEGRDRGQPLEVQILGRWTADPQKPVEWADKPFITNEANVEGQGDGHPSVDLKIFLPLHLFKTRTQI